MGVWQFLRIGFGADDVKATLCVICPPCIERLSGGKIEDQDEEALCLKRSPKFPQATEEFDILISKHKRNRSNEESGQYHHPYERHQDYSRGNSFECLNVSELGSVQGKIQSWKVDWHRQALDLMSEAETTGCGAKGNVLESGFKGYKRCWYRCPMTDKPLRTNVLELFKSENLQNYREELTSSTKTPAIFVLPECKA
ncbi:hypothetical protein BKA61DRAFT_576031 [Leptodontidium sp. MPI-SDFR-AT-0119]|nr:hypothetical protein BKA61DRAFT_576031 [Leptodontidium sp. MPI-SDFR-AT-0119]